MKNIYLCGFMGSGKTTVGRYLARQIEAPFLDTDREIEKRQGRKITEIFAQDGEPAFRRMERELLQELATKEGFVIATGGGMILKEENARLAKRTGYIVLLELPFEECYRRISSNQKRPIVVEKTKEELEQLYRERQGCYRASASLAVLSNQPPAVCAGRIRRILMQRERREKRKCME